MNKKVREIVYAKYKGHCAYCGCELEMKDMQIDHIVPKCRNYEKWAKEIGTDDIGNLNPSCRMCNYYKRMDSLEGFRERLTDMLMRNVRRPFDYRLAVKYGLVKEDVKKVKFYFESQGVFGMKTIEERAKEYSLKDFDGYYTGRERAVEEGYIVGASEQKAIDEEVRLKKCDDMTEAEYNRESDFANWYHENGKGTPTYSDAIEWARKEVIDKACEWLHARNVLTEASIEGFRKAIQK